RLERARAAELLGDGRGEGIDGRRSDDADLVAGLRRAGRNGKRHEAGGEEERLFHNLSPWLDSCRPMAASAVFLEFLVSGAAKLGTGSYVYATVRRQLYDTGEERNFALFSTDCT